MAEKSSPAWPARPSPSIAKSPGGSPLWLETQNVQADTKGNYTVHLGAKKPDGLPLDLFTSGEARWLGVTINGGQEQPRVLLLSVPYALKAADAETIGGLPPSAFMLAGAASAPTYQSNPAASSQSSSPAASSDVTTGGGTANTLPLFTTATNVQSSILTQSGSGTTGKIGINTRAPASTVDVNGAATVRGNLSLPATGAATSTAGKNSQPFSFTASSYNSGAGTAVNQNFRWQAEATGNNTATASGTLNLLHGVGSNALTETGLKFAGNGQITFAAGQRFPGTGTVTSVALTAPSSDFTVSGSPVLGSGTLALNWNTPPTSADTANAIVKRDGTGSFSAGSISAISTSSGGTGLYANAGSSTASNGVIGYGATGVAGNSTITGSFGTFGNGSTGVWGNSTGTGANVGVSGTAGSGGTGVSGSGGSYGVYGTNGSPGGVGGGFYNTSTGDALFAQNQASGSYAAFFLGNVDVDGNFSKAGGPSRSMTRSIPPTNTRPASQRRRLCRSGR